MTSAPRYRLPACALASAIAVLVTLLSPATASAGVPDRPLRVLTYNIHHGVGEDGVLDLERIARVIADSGADVIGLQEVDRHWSARTATARCCRSSAARSSAVCSRRRSRYARSRSTSP
jgi:endonuclease/exonuclease/phosphatase (EEP) superfamily protein YafD